MCFLALEVNAHRPEQKIGVRAQFLGHRRFGFRHCRSGLWGWLGRAYRFLLGVVGSLFLWFGRRCRSLSDCRDGMDGNWEYNSFVQDRGGALIGGRDNGHRF
jgi:hypothetical protein